MERSTFEEEIEEVICKINAALTRPQAQVSETAVTTRLSVSTIKVKLPKLSLPYFVGNPTQWIAYWDSFKSTIHNHPELSKVDKLKYLQTSLTGDAAQTISGFQITSKNYDEAIELLEKRFGNKQIIISRHIEDLMQLPKVSTNDDLRGLRILYDKLETTTRSLKSIGINSDSYSAILSPVIMSKLPSELRFLISRELKQFWEFENLGRKNDTAALEVDELMKNKIKFDGERYQITLPVKHQQTEIPDNYILAKKRLNCLLNRLKQKPELFEQYKNVIKEQIASGVVEQVSENEIPTGTTHYIPHSGVLKEDRKTTKLRVVYDASSKVAEELSLNECLHTGPNLLPLVLDVLLRFRMNKIALIGDLEKAFLQISIDPSQRDLLRFLWAGDSESENPSIIKLRFTRLAFGLTCSPYILNATIRHHLTGYAHSDPEFTKNVINSLYVEDYASSFSTKSEAFLVHQKRKEAFKTGGFNTRKWDSNCPELLKDIQKAENSICSQDSKQKKLEAKNVQESSATKVLGILWDQNSDKRAFDLSLMTADAQLEHVTKRSVLSTIARFYDPLGLLSPITVPLKQIYQVVCKMKVNWDAQLP